MLFLKRDPVFSLFGRGHTGASEEFVHFFWEVKFTEDSAFRSLSWLRALKLSKLEIANTFQGQTECGRRFAVRIPGIGRGFARLPSIDPRRAEGKDRR